MYDPSVAPPGVHTMSVFAQYVPYRFREGTGIRGGRRSGDGGAGLDRPLLQQPAGGDHRDEVLGPPDIERRVGLTGGHIFQGESCRSTCGTGGCRPRTPMPGVFLCGAGTHPGGSVIGINGRNAAMEVLDED